MTTSAKTKEPEWLSNYNTLIGMNISQRKACEILNIHRKTVQRYLKKQEELNNLKDDLRKETFNLLGQTLTPVKSWEIPLSSLYCYQEFGSNGIIKREFIKEDTEDNSVILIISDMHIPYHHPQLIPFLKRLKEKYNPTRVICIGDELDMAKLSYHEHDADLPSAGDELRLALKTIKDLFELFPKMDVLESNHGSLVYRKAKTHGIPRHYIKSYNNVLGVDDGWKWHFDLTVKLPDGQHVYFTHGKSADGLKLSQTMGMSCVQGHYHEKFGINYWSNPLGTYWSMQIGCLISDSSLAFAYNKVNLKRPIIGCGLIVNGKPVLELLEE